VEEWSTWFLFGQVFYWCFLVTFVFSVFTTTLHAWKKRKLSVLVVMAGFGVPLLQTIWSLRHEILALSRAGVGTVGRQTAAAITTGVSSIRLPARTPTYSNAVSLMESLPALPAALAELGSGELAPGTGGLEDALTRAGNVIVFVGAVSLALVALGGLLWSTSRPNYGIYYCFIVLIMMLGNPFQLTLLIETLKWLKFWRIVSWGCWIFEVLLLVVLPIAWALLAPEKKSREAVLWGLSPTALYVFLRLFGFSGWLDGSVW